MMHSSPWYLQTAEGNVACLESVAMHTGSFQKDTGVSGTDGLG